MKIERSVGTHDGSFHADEVTACALLTVAGLIDPDKIVRTRDPAKLENCTYVCDVGGIYEPSSLHFDHHQVTYTGRLSSAGMVLEYLRDEGIFSEEQYTLLHGSLVQGVDDHDNGRPPKVGGVCTFSILIANMLPIAYDATDAEFDAAFREAYAVARGHIQRLLDRHAYTLECREDVKAAMEGQTEVLIFDRKLPWLENFFALGGLDHPAVFVIMPAGDHWKLRGIPPSMDNRMGVRVALPANWAGLLDEELAKVSGIQEAVFCHKGRFISVWETKEAALAAMEKTLSDASS